jgi:hypothetical protein
MLSALRRHIWTTRSRYRETDLQSWLTIAPGLSRHMPNLYTGGSSLGNGKSLARRAGIVAVPTVKFEFLDV